MTEQCEKESCSTMNTSSDFDFNKSNVTFTRFKLTYSNDEDLEVFFSVLESELNSKQDDFVGICLLFTNDFLVYKTIKECEVDPEFNHLYDSSIDNIVVRKALFHAKDLPTTNDSKPIYFQFCYKDSNGIVQSKSTPFQIKGVGAPSNPATEVVETLMQNNENEDNDNVERQDEDEYIVVRSQDSFLKERLEHLTRKCNLMEYIIRSMEKDLSAKTIANRELQKELAISKQKLIDLQEEKEDVYKNIKEVEIENDNLKKENDDLKKENESLQDLLNNERDKMNQLALQLETVKQHQEKFIEKSGLNFTEEKLSDAVNKLKTNLENIKSCIDIVLKLPIIPETNTTTTTTSKTTTEDLLLDHLSHVNNSTAIDPIDQALRDLELAEDLELKDVPEQSQEEEKPEETMVKQLVNENETKPTVSQIKKISMPCVMCDKVIICHQHDNTNEQMIEMIEHFEKEHSQKMCPVCSALFDTRLKIFEKYFTMHVSNHFNQHKYP